jgi:hypothetical protein
LSGVIGSESLITAHADVVRSADYVQLLSGHWRIDHPFIDRLQCA